MTLLNILSLAAGLFTVAVLGSRFVRQAILRSRQRAFAQRRVLLEEVTAFKVKGCKHCGSSGAVKRAVNGQKNWIACGCAAKAFLARYGRDTRMLGPFRIWKRGRRPSNAHRPEGRRGAARAAA